MFGVFAVFVNPPGVEELVALEVVGHITNIICDAGDGVDIGEGGDADVECCCGGHD